MSSRDRTLGIYYAMIAGLVLAGGIGLRMGGRPKAGIVLGRTTLLEHAVRTLRLAGCANVTAVVPAGHPDLVDLARRCEADVVANRSPDEGMFSSVHLGVGHLLATRRPFSFIVVYPVDHPHIRPETISSLLTFAGQSASVAVRPSYDGRAGHPIVLALNIAEQLLSCPVESTFREAIRARCPCLCTVPTVDPGVLLNVNTPDDLARIP